MYEEFWLLSHVPGPRYLDCPVYILTSGETFSAAEELAYNLQSQHRAIIVGEATRGGAHAINEVLINPHIVAMIPVGRAINPITNTNWEGMGFQSQVPVHQSASLRIAHRHAIESAQINEAGLHPRVAQELRNERDQLLASGAYGDQPRPEVDTQYSASTAPAHQSGKLKPYPQQRPGQLFHDRPATIVGCHGALSCPNQCRICQD
jgi:hypothetical protein